AILLSFLQCSTFTRVSLLITVPINAVAEVNQQSALDLVTLSFLLFALSMARWFVLQLLWALSNLKGQKCSDDVKAALLASPIERTPEKPPNPAYTPATSSTPLEYGSLVWLELKLMTFCDPCMVASSPSHTYGLPRHGRLSVGTPSHSTPRLKIRHGFGGRNLGGVLDIVSQSRSSSPNQSVTSNSSFSGRPLCSGTTRLGQPCKKRALAGQDFCRVHEGGHNSY
ncbi:protein brambleberry precursor, partial [Silurus asotus]